MSSRCACAPDTDPLQLTPCSIMSLCSVPRCAGSTVHPLRKVSYDEGALTALHINSSEP